MNDREHMSDCSPRSPRDCQAGKRTHPSLVRVIPEAQSAKLLLLPQKRGKHGARHMTYVIACHNLTMCSVKKGHQKDALQRQQGQTHWFSAWRNEAADTSWLRESY